MQCPCSAVFSGAWGRVAGLLLRAAELRPLRPGPPCHERGAVQATEAAVPRAVRTAPHSPQRPRAPRPAGPCSPISPFLLRWRPARLRPVLCACARQGQSSRPPTTRDNMAAPGWSRAAARTGAQWRLLAAARRCSGLPPEEPPAAAPLRQQPRKQPGSASGTAATEPGQVRARRGGAPEGGAGFCCCPCRAGAPLAAWCPVGAAGRGGPRCAELWGCPRAACGAGCPGSAFVSGERGRVLPFVLFFFFQARLEGTGFAQRLPRVSEIPPLSVQFLLWCFHLGIALLLRTAALMQQLSTSL